MYLCNPFGRSTVIVLSFLGLSSLKEQASIKSEDSFNKVELQVLNLRNKKQCTMKSLILAQDER